MRACRGVATGLVTRVRARARRRAARRRAARRRASAVGIRPIRGQLGSVTAARAIVRRGRRTEDRMTGDAAGERASHRPFCGWE